MPSLDAIARFESYLFIRRHDDDLPSNLTQLIKLHLEQNEISEFRDVNVFCDLPKLMDLYLGDNALSALHFNLSCLHNLRFLDLRRNRFTRVLERDLHTMDNFAKHDTQVSMDFSDNPFECSCKLNSFIKWVKNTKMFVRNVGRMQCREGDSRSSSKFYFESSLQFQKRNLFHFN